jgi:5-enolpyruvylshikimate-3-phosphate synthase
MELQTLDKLVEMIFTGSPKPPCTYTLAVPDDNSTNMFQLLMGLLVSGCKKIYGENIQPSNITQSQFKEIQSYMESVGYVVKYNYSYNENKIPEKINIWFEQYIHNIDCHGRKFYNL